MPADPLAFPHEAVHEPIDKQRRHTTGLVRKKATAALAVGSFVATELFSATSPAAPHPKAVPSSMSELARLRDDIKELHQRLDAQARANDQLSSLVGQRNEQLSSLIQRQGDEIRASRREIAARLVSEDRAVSSLVTSSTRSQIAAVVLLLGLLVEIVGALLLAGPSLIAEQHDVFTLRSTPGLKDLAMTDTVATPRMDFLGSLGAIFLFLGFVIQFIGTLIALGVSGGLVCTLVAVAVTPAGLLFRFLLGQTHGQSRAQKLATIARNLRRMLPRVGRARCELCFRRVASEDTVRWVQEPATEGHPFLHPPHRWHVGHAECLDRSGWYLTRTKQPFAHTKNATIGEFLSLRVPEFDQWWDQHTAHWTEKRGYVYRPTAQEDEYRRILTKLRRG